MIRRIAALLAVALLAGCGSAGGPIAPRPAWEQPPPPPRDAPVTRPGALHRAELDNGLRVLLLEDRRLPRLSLGLSVRRGEASVPASEAGLASFTAALLERGAGQRGALQLANDVEALGARLSSFAGWDEMGVRVSGLSRDRDTLLEILGDVVLRPRFERAEAERVRGETLASLERALDDPATLASWNLSRALYDEHRFGLPRGGSPETVARLDAAAARAFHAEVFVPANAIVFASGDFDAKQLLERLGALFGTWHGGDPPPAGAAPPAQVPAQRRIVIVDRPDLEQARIAVGHEGIARTNDDRIRIQLMNSTLGGSGFSSRLMKSIRSEAGLTYGVYSAFSLRRSPGPFFVSTFTRVPETRRVLDMVLAELERMRSEPPSPGELRDAQMLSVGEFALGLETSSAVASALVGLDVYGLPEDSLDTFRGRVRAVGVEDVRRVAGAHLHPERLAIVLVGPAEALSAQVADLGTVEVVQP